MAEVPVCGTNGEIVVRGSLATGTVVAASGSAIQRVYIGGAGKTEINLTSANFSATATHKINLYGVFGGRISGDEGFRTSAPVASATIVSTVTTLSAVTYPYTHVDIEVAPGASSSVTVAGLVLCSTGGPST